ncbi:hypothetical protein [Vallitalea okinawensis]|uniref:hypothetical protein n=1 Tax=Vallitalea okinawensis TaxID=2078660 RepID=UPI000CFB472D|nr:hypothetical protein [Vallitalea okinawensis]
MQILSNSGYYWLADNMIYFDGSKHGYLHRANLDGTDMKKLTDFVIDRFEEIDDDIYIRRNKDDKWFLIDNKTDELIPIKKLPKK